MSRINVVELAGIVGVRAATIRRWRRDGLIPGTVNRTWDREHVLTVIAQLKVEMSDASAWLDTDAIAELAEVSTRTVREWTQYGRLPLPRIWERRRLWRREVVEVFLRENRQPIRCSTCEKSFTSSPFAKKNWTCRNCSTSKREK